MASAQFWNKYMPSQGGESQHDVYQYVSAYHMPSSSHA